MQNDLIPRLRRVRLLAMDVDGTLTDGGVYVFEDGQEFRRFDIKDGLGLKYVQGAGILVVWISASTCQAALHRARSLGIQEVYTGIKDKVELVDRICLQKNIPLDCVAYIGDDLTDLDLMKRVGIALAPSDAAREVVQVAALLTQALGGHGAVREVCDLILSARNTPTVHIEAK